MLNEEPGWSQTRAELLMDLTAALAQFTQKPQDIHHIPEILSRALGLQPLSLALIRTVADGSMVLLSASTGIELTHAFEQDLLDLHRQTRYSTLAGPLPPALEPEDMELRHNPDYPQATVFTQAIDEQHRLLLLIHRHAGAPGLAPDTAEILQLVTRQLGIFLEAIVIWLARPKTLGEPFDRLTEREWMVLRGLNTEAGEKQLADQMGLSPHTLHSHIKSIYRKVGVQGRLPLLRRTDDALRDLRLSRMNEPAAHVMSQPHQHALAVVG